MTDDQGREAYAIQWDAPATSTTAPAWDGPAADAETPLESAGPQEGSAAAQSDAPLGGPRNDRRGSDEARGFDSRDSAGWAGTASAGATAGEISESHPQSAGFGWSGSAGASRFEAPDRGDHAPRREERPASYSPAPSSGHTGADSSYAASGQTQPPQVVGNNDDLPDDSLTIGRGRDNSIVLDDMLVSRRHVVITADESGLVLRDLGSRNGTFVNGRRVEQTHLHEGDRLGVGASTFEVRDGWLVSV